MKTKLTDRFLQTVTAPATGRVEIGDSEASGLFLRVTSAGVLSWCVRYSPKGGKQARATIGIYRTADSSTPIVTLAAARARAKAIAAAAAVGRDLLAEEEAAKAAQAEVAARNRDLRSVVEDYVKTHIRPELRRAAVAEKLFDNHILPKLGKKRVGELRRADVVELLEDLRAKGLAAQVNRVHSALKACLNWAVEKELLETNPAAAVKRKVKESPRDRTLTDAELKLIWQAADALTEPSRSLIKVLILTGARRDEIRCMSWVELNRGDGIWTLPKTRNKGKRDHVVPLSKTAKAILEAMPRRGAHVFTSHPDGAKPYAGQKRLKEILDKALADRIKEPWVLHDIRRTVTTGMAAIGIREEVRERALNHAVQGVGNEVYDRHAYLEEKRAAFQAWADKVALLVGRTDGTNVLPMRSA